MFKSGKLHFSQIEVGVLRSLAGTQVLAVQNFSTPKENSAPATHSTTSTSELDSSPTSNFLEGLDQESNEATSAETTSISTGPQIKVTELSQISSETGVKDQDDILRALYTLEGKGLVTPDPDGDFTSSKWKCTDAGLATLNVIESSLQSSGQQAQRSDLKAA